MDSLLVAFVAMVTSFASNAIYEGLKANKPKRRTDAEMFPGGIYMPPPGSGSEDKEWRAAMITALIIGAAALLVSTQMHPETLTVEQSGEESN